MNDNIQPFLVYQTATVKEAMKRLETTSQKTVFVVDIDSNFVGSLTDGDIRRWILAEGSLLDAVEKMCNQDPYSVGMHYSLEDVRAQMLARNIACVPVINGERKIEKLLFWEDVLTDGRRKEVLRTIQIPVAIMAGGQGTRLSSFTRILPKPLIPIGDKTVLEVIIGTFLKHGINHFYLSVNYKSRIIKSYFEELNPPYSIEYIYEEKPLGTVGSLRCLHGKINGSLLVTNCDTIINSDLSELVEFHHTKNNDITLLASLKNYNIPYGVCEIENGGALTRITEKPEYNFLANTGMYVIKGDALKFIPPNEPFNVIQLIEKVKLSGGKVGVFPISESNWIDTGEWAEYKKALAQLSL